MIIYEVTLQIKNAIYEQYLTWLRPHIKEMLAFPGFIKADLLLVKNQDPGNKEVSIAYTIDNEENYYNYINHHAPKMRSEGIKKFDGQFSISRRVSTLSEIFHR